MLLKDKVKSALLSLKSKAKKAVELLITGVACAALIGGLTILAAKSPDIHRAWLRSSVGNEVVMIVKRDETGRTRGGGTGFHVRGPSGVTYILTNAHVCEAFEDGQVWVKTSEDDSRVMPRKIIEVSEQTDLCLVEGLPGYKGLKLASSASVGDNLSVVGHPILQPLSISQGEIIGKSLVEFPYAQIVEREQLKEEYKNGSKPLPPGYMFEAQCKSKPKFRVAEIESWFGPMKMCMLSLQAYETTIVGFPGNSGSPAVNFWGNLEAVLYAGNGYTNYSLLISLDDIKAFLAPY